MRCIPYTAQSEHGYNAVLFFSATAARPVGFPLEPWGESMQNLETAFIQCPYCWEQIEVVVDCSIRSQEYIEDCSVCCRPIVITAVTSHGEAVSIEARAEDEQVCAWSSLVCQEPTHKA